jgi:hypothetical protein
MEEFIQLFGNLLAFVYHCFDRMVIHGYLSGLSRPEQVVYFVRQVLGLPVVSKEVLSPRTADYRDWVEAYARNHHISIEWAETSLNCSPPHDVTASNLEVFLFTVVQIADLEHEHEKS